MTVINPTLNTIRTKESKADSDKLDCLCMLRNLFLSILIVTLFGCSQMQEEKQSYKKPNVLLIVVDDMGMADLGRFGGEIPTPNIDKLANQGVLFTNFHTSSVCSSTRAMLLTGVDNHKAGLGNMAEELAPNQLGQPGYEGQLNERVVTIASLLRDKGYSTFMTGKWHLGMSLEASPWAKGFDKSFSMLAGGASHFSDMKPAYHPDPNGQAPYRQDQQIVNKLPDNFAFSSQFFSDQMISYLQQRDAHKPFFAYLSFTAPHWPIQAPQYIIDKYKGKYDIGYDVVREQRLQKQISLGIVPPKTKSIAAKTPWENLSAIQKKTEARTMEVYAAMIDDLDQQIGRLITWLDDQQQLEKTVIIFMSDNGAEGHTIDQTWPRAQFPKIRKNIDERHDFSFANIGKVGSYAFNGPSWAQASSPAFRLYKGFVTEGGTRVPAFITYPAFANGKTTDEFLSVKDIVPTLLEITEIKHPAPIYNGTQIEAPSGFSMLDILRDAGSPNITATRVEGGEILGKYMIRKGAYKAVNIPPPHGNGNWQLYNVSTDLAEANDLSDEYPIKLAELIVEWEKYSEENGVILPSHVSGY